MEWNGEMEWNETMARRDGRPSAGCLPVPTSASVIRRRVRRRQCEKVSRSKVYNRRSNNSARLYTPFKRVASPATVVDQ